MKSKIKTILSAVGFIIVILFVFSLLNNNDNDESPMINVCNEDIYISDFYNKGIKWEKLEKEINETCKVHYEEYYYENPEKVCTDYIDENKQEICEE